MNHINIEEAEEAIDVVLGTLLVNSVSGKVLFDSGASHSFLSSNFASSNELPLEPLGTPLLVRTPGSEFHTAMVIHRNEIVIGGLVFLVSLIALKSSDIDVILGMDWLIANKAMIDCPSKSIQLTHPSGQIVHFSSHTPTIQLYALKANPLPTLKTVPVVCDFPYVFPEELPGMPLDLAVEFVIDLEPRITPISKGTYKMGPRKLVELKKQLEELEEERYIQS